MELNICSFPKPDKYMPWKLDKNLVHVSDTNITVLRLSEKPSQKTCSNKYNYTDNLKMTKNLLDKSYGLRN